MTEINVEYMVSGGTFAELSNGTRLFGDSPYGDVFGDFEDAYAFYVDIDLEEEHRTMAQSRLSRGLSVYKRMDRVEYRDDDHTEVDVIMFECFDGEEWSND